MDPKVKSDLPIREILYLSEHCPLSIQNVITFLIFNSPTLRRSLPLSSHSLRLIHSQSLVACRSFVRSSCSVTPISVVSRLWTKINSNCNSPLTLFQSRGCERRSILIARSRGLHSSLWPSFNIFTAAPLSQVSISLDLVAEVVWILLLRAPLWTLFLLKSQMNFW